MANIYVSCPLCGGEEIELTVVEYFIRNEVMAAEYAALTALVRYHRACVACLEAKKRFSSTPTNANARRYQEAEDAWMEAEASLPQFVKEMLEDAHEAE